MSLTNESKTINEKMTNCKTNEFESWMNYRPNFADVTCTKPTEMNLSIDSGSTYTRFCTFDSNQFEIGDVHQINSDISLVTNIEHVTSATKSLYSNLEFFIEDITSASEKVDKIFTKEHLVKGDLTIGRSVLERSSHISKTENKATYLNILVSIMLEILESIKNTNKVSSCYHVSLAITMPPKDFKSKKILQLFKERLKGHYTIFMPRIGIKTNIKITDNIYFENEPAAIIYNLADNEPDDIERSILDETAILVDGGGGTTDKAVIIEGRLVDSQAETSEFGGKMLLDTIARIYQSETGRSKPNLATIEDSLKNGILIRGNSSIDIFDYIKSAKEEVAQTIYNDLNNTCDNMRMSMDDIEKIILHGRLFKSTITEDGRETSVANILNSMLKNIAPNINVVVISGDDSVCKGAITSLWVTTM